MSFKNLFALFFMLFSFLFVSCESTTEKKQKPDIVDREREEQEEKAARELERITRELEEKNKNLTSYGKDKEVQAYIANANTYYILGGGDVFNMSVAQMANSSINTNIIKIANTNINGNSGITLTFYDVQIFLGKTMEASNTFVGVFEPQNNRWVLGLDIDNSARTIQIKLARGTAGPIRIESRSISRAYN